MSGTNKLTEEEKMQTRQEELCEKEHKDLARELGYLSYKVNKMVKHITDLLHDNLTLELDDKEQDDEELEDEIDVENIVERYKLFFKFNNKFFILFFFKFL